MRADLLDPFDTIGRRDPRRMPRHFFFGVLRLDYATAVPADPSRQNLRTFPRHWYVDAAFGCRRCGRPFAFPADEQRFWYEQLRFYIDVVPVHCPGCRRARRALKAARQRYDRDAVGAARPDATADRKRAVVTAVDALLAGGVAVPAEMLATRDRLAGQLGPVPATIVGARPTGPSPTV